MAGKIWSPLSSTSTLLPSTMGGPSSTLSERRNCGSSVSYRRVSWVSIFFSPTEKFSTSRLATTVAMTVSTTRVDLLTRINI